MTKSYNTIVLGLGAMGSATLYQLAKRGDKVLGIDKYDPPHTMGSSHGDSRITRQAIGEGVEYTPLALRSYEIIRELEDKTAHRLLLACGGLMISNKEGQGVHHVQNFFDTTVAAATEHHIKHEILDAIDIKRRFPAFKVAAHEYAYYEPEAGILYPEKCISTQISVAKSMGAAVHTGEEVLSYKETADGVIVKTTNGEYTAKQLIITAGPWLPELLNKQSGLSLGSGQSNSSELSGASGQSDSSILSALSANFKIVRQVMYWFDIKEHYQNFKPGHFPIFIWEGYGALASSYGFPAIDGPDGGFKMASPKFNEIVTPDTIDRQVSQEAIDEIYDAQVSKCFDGVSRTCLRTAVCMYTDTQDSRFVIGKLPGSEHTIIASPCSGHGFKHSPAIGECLAQLALDGASKLDISGFGVASIF